MFPSHYSPLERLLTAGGDTRLEIVPQTGRNRYECCPRPCDATPFGSCTSSTISSRGYTAAQEVHRIICGAPDSRQASYEFASFVQQRLSELLMLPANVDVALAPSGTDAELLALALALAAGGGRRPVVNIVVGPSEVGSGTPLAAACCHYDRLVPSGACVQVGSTIDAQLASRVDVRTVDLRTPAGDMLSESEIDAAVIELFLEANDADAITLLHIVAHSKTGVHAPSLSCVDRLAQSSDDVIVVVDAAQGRFSRRGLRDVLQKGYLVMFTGSKFYGGPPFSGALLVPRALRPEHRQIDRFPVGFADYFTAAEMPETWTSVRRELPVEPNLGGLLRWAAALAEMEAYYAVPNEARLRVLRFFEAEVPRILGGGEVLRLLPVFPPVYDDTAERLLESKTTVFGFWVTPPGARRSLGKADLKQLHAELATNLSESRDAAEEAIGANLFHLGQPVDLGSAGCVLRVALGGELITRVASDPRLGTSLDARLEWLGGQLIGLRRKVEHLAATYSPTPAEPPGTTANTGVFDHSLVSTGN